MKHGLAVVFFLPVVTASSLLYAQSEPAVCYLPLQPPAAFTALDSTDPAVRITSDQVSLTDNQQANFDGNVQISYRDTLLLAPKANFSSASQLMHAEGGINYFNQALQVSGTVFSANLQQNQARLDNASYRFLAQAGRGYAAALTATEQEVMLDDALFTTCPQQDNSWALHASEINIETDAGWGEARHAVFKIKDIPVLYLSSHIVQTKADYYRLLQTVRDNDTWEDWVLYMLQAVEITARQTVTTVQAIKAALFDYKHRIRSGYKFYSQDLINNLFMHPYTKIEFVQRDLQVSRLTATKYLEALVDGGFLGKQKVGRSNYYVNTALNGILLAQHQAAR